MKKLLSSIMIIGFSFLSSAAYAVDCSGLSTWSASAVYTGGDQVQSPDSSGVNTAYKANWWTQGNDPATNSGQAGSGKPWLPLGACGTGGNVPPTANANGPYSATLGSAISFSSAGSSDSDGSISSYAWDFGDGNSSTQANPSHTYASAGTFTVTLTVTDNESATGSATSTATVTGSTSNVPPTANANGPYSATIGAAISFSSAGSNDSDGSIASYSWNFGDGSSSTQANPSHTYAAVGSYTVTLTVTDNDGATGSATSTATVTDASSCTYDVWNSTTVYNGGDQVQSPNSQGVNTAYQAKWWTQGNNPATSTGPGQPWEEIGTCGPTPNVPPVANPGGPYFETLGTAVSFNSAGSNDPDGTITSYLWTFGDGNTSTQANPSHTYAAMGDYTVSLTVTDNEGDTGAGTTSVTINDGTTPPPGDNKLIGYFAQWGVYARNYHVKNIATSGSASKLTHIMYAFGNVTNGQCVIGDAYADYEKAYTAAESVDGVADTWDQPLRGSFNQLRKLKLANPGLKVIWSFGGWTWSGGFGQAAANPQAFAESCYNLVHDPRWDGVFDGIDMDWEYPNECGLTCDTSGYSSFSGLMSALRARFGNEVVSAAISTSPTKHAAADYGVAANSVDFYMVMTYDMFGAWDKTGPTAPHSPLYSYSGIPIAEFSTHNGMQSLKGLGVPADKLLLGIGFYGRGWTGVTQSAPGGSATGAATGSYESGIEDYKVLKNTCPSNGTIAGTAYAHCGSNWWSYDTPATISGKMNYVNQQQLGGAFFWEFSGDTSNGELIQAMSSGL